MRLPEAKGAIAGAFPRIKRITLMESSERPPCPSALVVEGETLVRMDAADILEDAGFRVLEAGTGDRAVELLRQHHNEITLLFTAVRLQGQHDGFALARMIAADYSHISVVVASGHHKPEPSDMPEVACFIDKPFSAGIVRKHLQRIMPDDQKPAPLKD